MRDKLLGRALDAAQLLYGLVCGVELGIAGPRWPMAVLMTLNQNGQAISLGNTLRALGVHSGDTLATTREFVSQRPHTARALVMAVLAACRFLDEAANRARAASLLAAHDCLAVPAPLIAQRMSSTRSVTRVVFLSRSVPPSALMHEIPWCMLHTNEAQSGPASLQAKQ